ncbi:hypothetical protein PHLCEN_2v6001 [Hermanssonia centrifuga]|uniref:F-box domain-containing protein n=1 Tax=Hermanssonia centrifuga TaxID=98765 RepID=A0A2R6P0J5_9APHY|nr:hypothetical protein PHLCEN_2v6001 [Hermanssonia centrifuga]
MLRDPPLSLLDVPDEILLLVTFFLDPVDVIHFAKPIAWVQLSSYPLLDILALDRTMY